MLHALRKIIPKQILQMYHFCLAKIAVFVYKNPSRKLIVIGVTGTNGKSSTVQMIAQMLESLGEKVGYTTTAGFYIAGQDIENKMKLTMPGRFYLQRMLKEMVVAGCRYAIIETSSQGIEQYRHLGINYDLVTYTNLTPEHIEAHGGFEAYKKAKSKLFTHLMHRAHKNINGKKIEKTLVINADDEHAAYFLSFPADRQITYSIHGRECNDHIVIKNISSNEKGLALEVCGEKMQIPYIATFQQKNAISALSVCYALGYPLKKIAKALNALEPIAGRFERVDCGQDFAVIVDYAYEPYALHALLDSVKILNPKRIIGIHGSAGGGRDRARRYKIGQIVADHEDIVIVTNEDPYDEDPRSIIEEVAKGARESGMKDNVDLFLVDDRKQAIQKAISIAKKGDVVLITGKGSETVMAVKGGKLIPFDDRKVTLEALKNR